MYLWPTEFNNSRHPNSTVRELAFLLKEAPFSSNVDSLSYRDSLQAPVNGVFTVKSFYNFLNDGELHSSMMRFFWHNVENQSSQLADVEE